MHEPRDGDFVAYLEALQRESAARLAKQAGAALDQSSDAKSAKEHFFDASVKPGAARVDQAVERLVRQTTDARLVKALVAAVIGAMLLLVWVADGGALPFLFAVALLAYAIPRLVDSIRRLRRDPTTGVAIEQVFGRQAGKRK